MYPTDHVQEDLSELCTSLKHHPVCALSTQCTANPAYFPDGFCEPWALLATACTDPAAKNQTGCEMYGKFCAAGTKISQCDTQPIANGSLEYSKVSCLNSFILSFALLMNPTRLNNVSQIQQQYTSICTSMPGMSSCNLCPAYSTTAADQLLDCDVLADYSAACREMSGMSQCATWKSLCTGTPKNPYCTGTFTGGSSSSSGSTTTSDNPAVTYDAPPMLMYFHSSTSDYFAFQNWLPKTGWQYALSLVAVFLLGMSTEGIGLLRTLLERKFETDPNPSSILGHAGRDIQRFALASLAAGWSYLLMLIVMNFNVGAFFAAIFGIGAGSVIWGYVRRNAFGGLAVGRAQGVEVDGKEGHAC